MSDSSWSELPLMLDVTHIQTIFGCGRDAATQWLKDQPETVTVGRNRLLISRNVVAVTEGVNRKDAEALQAENADLHRRLDAATTALAKVAADAAAAAGAAADGRHLKVAS